jgi:lipopolysaccharide transport system ATP-binding protein
MNEIAIKVENLSKRYRIGLEEEIPDTFVGAAKNFLLSPIRNFRQLRALSRFEDGSSESEDGKETGDGRRETGNAASPSSVLGPPSASEASDIIWALKDVSFEVKRGEVVGIIGRNGAGKSTLLKILSRITHPTSGRVKLNGRVSSLLEVGTGFHPELTGRENIYLNGTILGMTKDEVDRKFDEIVDFSGVEKFIDTPVKRYSSGMKVRLAFSVAAHLEPEILLIDEVLAVGDARFQKKCLGKMREVTGEGRTVLFVSHNMPSIEALCDRTILLDEGRSIFDGDTGRAINRYLGKSTFAVGACVDLQVHPNRADNSTPIFQQLRILNVQEKETTAIRLGNDVIFELLLDTDHRKIEFPRIQINILDIRENSVCRFVSDIMDKRLIHLIGKNIVRCYWKDCRLMPGTYSINLHIRDSGVSLDKIIDAASIDVLPSDVHGTGKLDREAGVFIPDGKWEFKETFEIVKCNR